MYLICIWSLFTALDNGDAKTAPCQGMRWSNPDSEGIDFSRRDLTSVDVKYWRLKSIPAL